MGKMVNRRRKEGKVGGREAAQEQRTTEVSLHAHSCANHDDIIMIVSCLSFELTDLLTYLAYPLMVSIELQPLSMSPNSRGFHLGRGLGLSFFFTHLVAAFSVHSSSTYMLHGS